MKKQIAILGIIIALPGFVAFGQNWVTVQESGNNRVWEFTDTPITSYPAPAGAVNLEVLWAPMGATDLLSGTDTNGLNGPPFESSITYMLSNGWNLMQDFSSGNGIASLGTVETTTGGSVTKGGSIIAFNGGNPFEFDTTTAVPSGGSIQFIWVGFVGGSSYATASALGVSGDSTVTVGTTEGDPNATSPETASPFGVGWVTPEPATLALIGLGGLSMLMLRRRKA